MPRKSKGVYRQSYSDTDMAAAIQAVTDRGMSKRQTAKYNSPMSIPSSSSLSGTFPPDESRPYIPSLTATSTSAFLEEPLPSTEPLPTETVPTFAPEELDLVPPEETSQICDILELAMLASGIIDENRNDAPSTQMPRKSKGVYRQSYSDTDMAAAIQAVTDRETALVNFHIICNIRNTQICSKQFRAKLVDQLIKPHMDARHLSQRAQPNSNTLNSPLSGSGAIQ
ncbi:hypothetical protein PoB_004278800 [Plakobranchus ocellatus]|uniref:Uncharacterized protein n=1 Tax=Plakobranchus ocellatus TaxID=259542 RepID=A0AAV4B9N2_9GAST|nr:hypothetical protein PoB_004278800 [Plakobranchus ocellatus]